MSRYLLDFVFPLFFFLRMDRVGWISQGAILERMNAVCFSFFATRRDGKFSAPDTLGYVGLVCGLCGFASICCCSICLAVYVGQTRLTRDER